jgi:hypothetical protein
MDRGKMEGIHIFYIIFVESFRINYTTLKLAIYLEVALGKHEISSPRQWHYKHKIHVGPLGSWLKEKWKESIFSIIFLESFPIHYTTLKLATYLEEALGNTKYHHQDSGIPNTRFVLVFLENGILYNLLSEFAHKLYYFEVGHLPRRGIRKHQISSPGQWHSNHRILVDPLGS